MSSDRGAWDALDHLFEESPPTLGPTEVAERLGVSKKSVYTWLREGLVPGYKVGSTWFIIRDELKATLRRGANVPRDTGSIAVPPEPPEGD